MEISITISEEFRYILNIDECKKCVSRHAHNHPQFCRDCRYVLGGNP